MSGDTRSKQPTEDEDLFDDATEPGSGMIIVGSPPAPASPSEPACQGRVKIYVTNTRTGEQEVLGELRLEGGKIVPSNEEVADIAARPIVIGGKSAKEPYVRIDPIKEPRRFLENLHKEYNASFLRASELKPL